MAKRHLKRIAAPKNWVLPRKHGTWVTRPNPGPHPKDRCITLDYVIREIFHSANSLRESKKCIKNGQVQVDKKPVLDHKRPIGLMDVISTKEKDYRVVLGEKSRLTLLEIPKEQSHLKLCKVTGKTMISGGKIQLCFHDGRTLLTDQSKIKVGDSIILDLTHNTIKEHLTFDKGCTIYLTGGTHLGSIAFFEGIRKTSSLYPDLLIVKSGDNTFETAKRFAFVVGKSAPSLIISSSTKGGKAK